MKHDSNKIANKSADVTDEDAFFVRWSRRKHAARQQVITDPPSLETSPATTEDVALPTDADMPPLESLTDDSDYRGFLSPRVSEALRKQALRRLFRSPGFNVRDGLDDYDDDFTQFEKIGDIITADMKHQLDMEAQRIKQLAEEEVAAPRTHSAQNPPEPQDDAQQAGNVAVLDDQDDVEAEKS